MAPIGMLAGFMLAAGVTYVMPKSYESTATIEIRPRARNASPTTSTPQFFSTEFEKIKSRNSLKKVVESLDLTEKWDMDEEQILQILRGKIMTENIRGTDLVSLKVRQTNREDARDIAASVANTYKEYRAELEGKSVEQSVSDLKRIFQEQEEKVEELKNEVERSKGSLLHLTEEGSKKVAQELRDLMANLETEQSLLDQLKLELIAGELATTLSADSIIIHDDPVLAQSPISPNVTLNLVLGAIGGLLLSPFFALPLMWVLNRRNPV